MTGWHSGSVADGTQVAVLDRQGLHQDLLRGISAGLRSGVPVEALDGYQAFQSLEGLVLVHERRAQAQLCRAELSEVEALERQARNLAVRETNVRARAGYEEDVREYGRRAEALAAEIRALEVTDDQPLAASVDVEVEFLLQSLTVLTHPVGQVEKAAAAALRKVLDGLRLEVRGDWVHWRSYLLVPASGRVLRVGPFTGKVSRRGRILTPAEAERLASGAGRPRARRLLKHALLNAGFPTHLAYAATLAPAGLLPKVLLGEDVEWPETTSSFDHARFNEHVRAVWGAHPAWSKVVYCQTNKKRQTLTDLVAALGGMARVDQLRAAFPELGIKNSDLLHMTLPRPLVAGVPEYPPSVQRVGTWSAAGYVHDHFVRSILCPRCAAPATAVVRVPEVPGALLCRTCLVPPTNPELEFPPLYGDLALPATPISETLIRKARAVKPGVTKKGGRPNRVSV